MTTNINTNSLIKLSIVLTCVSLGLLASALAVWNFFSPPDWVKVELVQVPSGIRVIYIVARDGEKIYPINIYSDMFGAEVLDSRINLMWAKSSNGKRRSCDLQWKSADSYGILARRETGEWLLWWIAPHDMDGPPPARSFRRGVRHVTIRAAGVQSAITPALSLSSQFKGDRQN